MNFASNRNLSFENTRPVLGLLEHLATVREIKYLIELLRRDEMGI